jgi:hypothetical protein
MIPVLKWRLLMIGKWTKIIAVVVFTPGASVSAQVVLDSTEELGRIDVDEKLGARIPLELTFADETGDSVRLAEYLTESSTVSTSSTGIRARSTGLSRPVSTPKKIRSWRPPRKRTTWVPLIGTFRKRAGDFWLALRASLRRWPTRSVFGISTMPSVRSTLIRRWR